LDLDISPKAVPLIKAIQTCTDTIQLHLTPAGKLSVKSGSFKAFIDCINVDYPEVEPEGEIIEMNGNILKALKVLSAFIADDASRSWARGILLKGGSAFATNNICLVEYWLGYDFPLPINIPRSAIVELLRINEEPVRMQVAENSVTFHFSGNRWLRTQTYSTEWPDLHDILDADSSQSPIPGGLWDAVESLVPFTDELGKIFIKNKMITTGQTEGEGASVELSEIQADGCFHFEQLLLLKSVAKTIDMTSYPRPCIFTGDNLRGAIIGMRV
jgi:hypothetical protein